MKRYIFIAILFFVLALFTSCEKDLDQVPLSSGTTENFYATENDFLQARNATYSMTFHGSNAYGYANRILNLSETRSDNLYATTIASRTWEGINNFFTSITSNSYVQEAYTTNYNAIYKANQLLEKLDENGTVITDEAERNTMRAEARFLRAFCYFDLIRWFGKVPLLDRTLTPQEVAQVERSPVSDIYDLILSDLEFAVENLPPSYDGSDYGRVTRFGAKGILALAYMTRSSPDYGIEGPGMGLDEWTQAYQQLSDIKDSGLYAFGSSYDSIFKVEGSVNKENVLVIPYGSNTGDGVGGNFPIEVSSDEYFAFLGLSDQGALERRPVSPEFRQKFAPEDERAQFGIIDTFTVDSGRYAGFYNEPLFIKYADDSRYGDGRTDWGVDFIVLRYTDVLFLMAECTLHGGGGSQADVDNIVNDVRERAGLDRDASGVSLQELFEERRKEFFSEGSRWFDLFRSGNAVDIMNDWKARVDNSDNINAIDENSLLYPIPLQELLSVPGLYEQNPGY
ncbi:RagB/SusD family nutrient uptake outer membrane protein [Sinomicrobium sp. M5D2P17]